MGVKKSKQMKKYVLLIVSIFSCSSDTNEKIISSLKQDSFKDFKNYEIEKRGVNYILWTDTLNFKISQYSKVEAIATMSKNGLKKGHLDDSIKIKVTRLINCMRVLNIVKLERNEDYFEIFQSDSNKPLIVKIH
jgi:hypothetical protein